MDIGNDRLFSMEEDLYSSDCDICKDRFCNVSDFKLRIDYNLNAHEFANQDPNEERNEAYAEIIARDTVVICGDCFFSFILKETDFLKYVKLSYFYSILNDEREEL